MKNQNKESWFLKVVYIAVIIIAITIIANVIAITIIANVIADITRSNKLEKTDWELMKAAYMEGCDVVEGFTDYCECTYYYITSNETDEDIIEKLWKDSYAEQRKSLMMGAIRRCQHLVSDETLARYFSF